MRILFLHISDIHLEKYTDINWFQVQKMIDSLQVVGSFDYAIIIVSGDIAYSGKRDQYDFAWKLIGTLVVDISKKYTLKLHPIVYVVPGNHDVDLSVGKGDLGHAKIQELYKNQQMDSKVASECEKLNAFLNYSARNGCLCKTDPLFSCKILNLGGFKIEVNLLNTALFSTLDEEKGLHYLPQHAISRLPVPTNADFVVSVMHHSHHWFTSENKIQLEQMLFGKSSLLFLGHEHNLDTLEVSSGKAPSVQVLAGGELANRGNWANSSYFASIFDTKNRMFKLYGYKWNHIERVYEHSLVKEDTISPKPSCEKKLAPTESYMKYLCQDEKRTLAQDFSDYFVFPRLQREESSERTIPLEVTNEKKFLEELYIKKKIIIVGYDNWGKTLLLKHIFKTLSAQKLVLFCDIYNLSFGSCERVIKSVFGAIYGDNSHDYMRFEQAPKQEKVLMIDDIHRMDPQFFESFIKEAEERFEYIIFSTRNVMELDIHERLKKVIYEDNSFQRYRITPFYSDKRYELLYNVVSLRIEDEEEQIKVTDILSEALKKQRSLANLDPDFIIQYAEYYCKNINETSQNDGEVFSKVFETNIVNAVKPHLSKKISVDKLFIVMDKVAYFIHCHKAYPLSLEQLTSVIDEYNQEYDPDNPDLKTSDFIKITTNAKIIKPCGNGFQYKFCNTSYLAYFTAREIKRRYHNGSDNSDLTRILNLSCFGINADILLFLTYINDNPNMLRFILQMAMEYTNGWPEFELSKINIPYLSSINPLDVSKPTAEERKLDEEADIEQEKRIIDNKHLDIVDIYDYNEEDIGKTENQLGRSIAMLSVISRCLPSFEHMMKKEDKELFVDMIYRLPNQIFYLWAINVDIAKTELIEFVKLLEECEDYSREKLTDEQILRVMQWDAMSILLDIYNFAVTNSTKENSEKYLNAYGYKSAITYSLQHLMVQERRDRIPGFIKEAETILNTSKNAMSKTMAMRIVKHLLIHSKTIQQRDIQQLEAKFSLGPSEHKRILLQRANSENET